ncbi:MAG: oxidoreductase, short chain dehydrogenase/reductase family [uncultured bacterium]|nr:MAG: oxidoreductase, short chain dehydrogenase/reductase family [uncultured bacterium]
MKIALITGVSKGLGKSLAIALHEMNISVIGVSRSKPDFPIDHWIEADISKESQRDEINEQILKITPVIDILINNAGIGLFNKWEDLDEGDLRKTFELNFFVPYLLTRNFLPQLKQSKGTIINISSVAGIYPVPKMGGYCASKYALNAFSDTIRTELKSTGVNVLNVILGKINTQFQEHALGNNNEIPGNLCEIAAEKAARKIIKACINRKKTLIYPNFYKLIIFLVKTFPGMYDLYTRKKWNL